MALYTQPKGDGTRWVMNWDDYVKHGFKEELATTEDMPERVKLAYMETMRKEAENE